MEMYTHSINALFEQHGLESTDGAIEQFISNHKPLEHNVLLHEADFWNDSQALFLKEAIETDNDWVSAVDHLGLMLR